MAKRTPDPLAVWLVDEAGHIVTSIDLGIEESAYDDLLVRAMDTPSGKILFGRRLFHAAQHRNLRKPLRNVPGKGIE